jgi:hypothetical protein
MALPRRLLICRRLILVARSHGDPCINVLLGITRCGRSFKATEAPGQLSVGVGGATLSGDELTTAARQGQKSTAVLRIVTWGNEPATRRARLFAVAKL